MFHFESYLVDDIIRNYLRVKLNAFVLWIEKKPLLKIVHCSDFVKGVGAGNT
jgi:hypothetical protein